VPDIYILNIDWIFDWLFNKVYSISHITLYHYILTSFNLPPHTGHHFVVAHPTFWLIIYI